MAFTSTDFQNAQKGEPPSVSRSSVDRHQSTVSSQSLFQNARDFEVKDSQFNMTMVNNTDPVSNILWPHVVAGAIFDSAMRYPAGKCHPGTRKKIIERIVNWINDPDPNQGILWLYGPAGAGKSAIAHTICDLLKQSHPDSYGGCFFFESGPTDRGNALKLFATLSYQLSVQFPSMRTEINNTLFLDPSLPTKSMEIQFHSLIIQPLLHCQNIVSHIPILIIDGLDECADDDTQRKIVALIAKSIVDYDLPLRVMIASRPEYWIRDAFDAAPLPNISLLLSLRDDIDADNDIKTYLTDEFEKIRLENKRIMKSMVAPWPPTKIIKRFVEEASGQYIYAATILKFVGNFSRFSSPQKQLEILIFPGPHRALAFSDLDRLYATILSSYPRWENMKRVIAGILVQANATILEIVLGVDSDEVVLVLDALSSLIDIKEPLTPSEKDIVFESIFDYFLDGRGNISFCHRSFQEFLQDKTRSGNFYIDLDSDPVPHDILAGYCDMIQRNIDQNYEFEPPLFLNIDLATYHWRMENVIFLSARHCSIATLLPLIKNMTSKLQRWDTGKITHMQSLFYLMREMEIMHEGLYELFDESILQFHEEEENLDPFIEFRAACKNFADALVPLRQALFALPSCTDFEVTPGLVYLVEYNRPLSLARHIEELSTFAGIADGISTMRNFRYLLPSISIRPHPGLRTIDLCIFPPPEEPSWRTEGAWGDLRIAFAYRSLKLILKTDNLELLSIEINAQYSALTKFFNSRRISDISTPGYFQNTYNIALLEMITDLEAWAFLSLGLFSGFRHHFLVSILCWINRQLTNPQTVTLLQEHDETLHQTLTITMKYIFENVFLTEFCRFYNFYENGLFTFMSGQKITAQPLPQGLHEDPKVLHRSVLVHWLDSSGLIWRPFHHEVFGEMTSNIEASTSPIIDPSHWYPHLVTQLLHDLVKFLQNLIHQPSSRDYFDYEEVHPYIVQCLPYAQPTRDNLDALRAIVYLYPRLTRPCEWNPPEGFWRLLMDFLQKYDRSVLSSEELDLFLKWLNSTEHADITTYV